MKAFTFSFMFVLIANLALNAQTKVYNSQDVDSLPIIEDCEEPSIDCFQEDLKNYIEQNIDIVNLVKHTSAKAYAQFVISASGEIKDIKIRTTNKTLEKESYKLLRKLKIQSPATLKGLAVDMRYVTPISFKRTMINETEGFSEYSGRPTETEGPNIAFRDAATPPSFKECNSSGNESCFEDLVIRRILNFLETSKSLSRERKDEMKIKIYFQIEPNGKVSNSLVVCKSEKIIKKLSTFLNTMKVSEAAKNQNGESISTYFLKTVIL
ncbi:hypothetical protein BC962_0918 [Gillisia mitskevichiae]|uniref:TonB-like protein n=1 Tax=Gillisia mitskevichiae TaxID=270921 RepID=A0A495PZJ5_9FLAO|nr:hypothetical protein [Gillisia mitskevichiae]RKS55943.1 hypothetical protein BC962_0918 [Gillisia mitskevichiae]